MKTHVAYPFYSSLRFRFGLIFGFVFLCFLLVTGITLYSNVKSQFEKSFDARLQTQGNAILRETDINPLTIPLPAQGEYFRLIYQANNKQDTLFNNLPVSVQKSENAASLLLWRWKELTTKPETGGIIRILYVLPATELIRDINRLKIILFLYFPLSFLPAFFIGYFLSGFLLRPIENIVKKADDISLQNQIILLEEPSVKDELHKLTGSLNKMLTRIQKQAQEQNAFFASASHELRTPLSVMLTELQILQNDRLPSEVKPVIENQITEVQRLNKVVNDFLLMSQLRSGVLVFNKTVVNLPEVAIEILERLAAKAQLKQQTFKIVLTPENGEFDICTDRSHLKTILLNLLENALKHGRPESVIRIEIKEALGFVSLQIQNPSIFEIDDIILLSNEFSKQDSYGDGFGLGLWIVSRLAEMIGAKFSFSYDKPDFRAELSF
ncbi:HAMP domain-containing sensor histidine kinase [Dyadobacter sp. CY356]|uniref:HAMP domain-containing sensor histidine kinase n=1 Tax=Dyadobacter sp. CY356 TaxID=2906442 RepID=UPI001F4463A3|nr:HAMP domain-containing sensor histidine kinase [Dyadobacter sp. CY356]MCF0059132.1 HAMP domain-containing histidine kinase [Dyadobacter sp. CY356]